MLKKILIGLLIVLVALVIVIAMQPNSFSISRKGVISAPALVIFEQVNNFHKWEAWSPWDKMDPNMKRVFSGPESGKGSAYAWDGNDKVGTGSMTLTESKPGELIQIKLEFKKPFEAVNDTEFRFAQEGDKTVVTWTMSGTNNFVSKAFSLFMNIDKMVGQDFEKGLASLKTVSEGAAKK
jgi:Polyketide cyclase / dehydrase and lipid transport